MNNVVESKRIQYTAGKFAKESLIYLQEVGTSKTNKANTNARKHMNSYLFFLVLEGKGTLTYDNETYEMEKGDCAFINCHTSYSHYSENWKISWLHIYGANISQIYQKYKERNGKTVFHTQNDMLYSNQIEEIYQIANSDNFIKDMAIYSRIINTLHLLMSETVYEDTGNRKNKYDIQEIKAYIDMSFAKAINLKMISERFFINKYYLTRLFKDSYGITINNYILEKRITKAKEMLRFSNLSIEDIASQCGINDPNYFSRIFKKIEGTTPKEYRKMW